MCYNIIENKLKVMYNNLNCFLLFSNINNIFHIKVSRRENLITILIKKRKD